MLTTDFSFTIDKARQRHELFQLGVKLYHHDWKLAFQGEFEWRVHWFGRYGGSANWAAAVKLNPVYFGRSFKRETGLKPMESLNQRRLEMAAQYLSGTSKTVTEIATECGYACPFYFSRQFRRCHGLAPLRYRQTSFERKPERSAKQVTDH
jgi:AraC-like DNA-binding protein